MTIIASGLIGKWILFNKLKGSIKKIWNKVIVGKCKKIDYCNGILHLAEKFNKAKDCKVNSKVFKLYSSIVYNMEKKKWNATCIQ